MASSSVKSVSHSILKMSFDNSHVSIKGLFSSSFISLIKKYLQNIMRKKTYKIRRKHRNETEHNWFYVFSTFCVDIDEIK